MKSFRFNRWMILFPIVAMMVIAAACGDDATSTPRPTATTSPTATPEAMEQPAWVQQGKRSRVLNMLAFVSPDHWDLHQSCCAGGPGTAAALFNNLVQQNPVDPDELEGNLAKSWTLSSDSMSYTFEINKADWTDGEPVTAADVKFSLDRMAEDKG